MNEMENQQQAAGFLSKTNPRDIQNPEQKEAALI
jgi:hypothetical protein